MTRGSAPTVPWPVFHRSLRGRLLAPGRLGCLRRLGRSPACCENERVSSRPDLHADCANCFGLCCVALPFSASADFAISKDAGQPCVNLQPDFGCGIHTRLRERGFSGCAVYDCFGAGQKVSQHTFDGQDWRAAPGMARQMFEVFPVMRHLHELLQYLTEAVALPTDRSLHRELNRVMEATGQLTLGSAEELMQIDVSALRDEVSALLLRTSETVRSRLPGRRKNHRGADLTGARLAGADLRGASLRGARLIAADLSGADLRCADLIGTDLRDADLSGADLAGSLFLTQPQIAAAKGSAATRIPEHFSRPAHWSVEQRG
jgi:uncharacterized protein YjbI with pentapeptide repeats